MTEEENKAEIAENAEEKQKRKPLTSSITLNEPRTEPLSEDAINSRFPYRKHNLAMEELNAWCDRWIRTGLPRWAVRAILIEKSQSYEYGK